MSQRGNRNPDSASGTEPGVEVGLGAVVYGPSSPSEVVEEALGGADLLSAAVDDGWAELAVTVGLGASDHVPGGVASQRLLVSRVGYLVDDSGREAAQTGGVLVAFGKGTRGDEEGAQIGDGESLAFGVEELVAELFVLAGQLREQAEALGVLPVAEDRARPPGVDETVAHVLE